MPTWAAWTTFALAVVGAGLQVAGVVVLWRGLQAIATRPRSVTVYPDTLVAKTRMHRPTITTDEVKTVERRIAELEATMATLPDRLRDDIDKAETRMTRKVESATGRTAQHLGDEVKDLWEVVRDQGHARASAILIGLGIVASGLGGTLPLLWA